MKIGDLITFKIDYDADQITDIGIVTKIEAGYPRYGDIVTIVWEWGQQQHRAALMHVLSERMENKNEYE